jgi:hypothetical protein
MATLWKFRDSKRAIASLLPRISAVIEQTPLPSESFAGLHRSGTSKGSQWGTWLVNRSPLEPVASVDSVDIFSDFIPSPDSGHLTWSLDTDGYPCFRGSTWREWPLRLHRQVFCDVFGIQIPAEVDIHHRDPPSAAVVEGNNLFGKGDARLMRLELMGKREHQIHHQKATSHSSSRSSRPPSSGLTSPTSSSLTSAVPTPAMPGSMLKRRKRD